MAALIGDLYSMNRQAAAPINTNVPNLNQYFPQEEEEKEEEPKIGQQSPEPSGMTLKEQEIADTKLNQVLETKRLWLGDDYQFNEIEAKTIKALALNSENPDDAVSRYIAASGVSSMTGMSVNYAYTNLDNISEYYTGHSFEAKDVGMWTKIKAGFERVELMSMKDEWMKLDIAGKTDEAAALEKKIKEKEAATADLLSALPTSAYDKIETAVLTNLGYIGVPTVKGIATSAAAGITMKSMLGAAVAAGSINPVAGAVITAVSIPILTYATLRGTSGLEIAKYQRGEDYWSYMHDNGDGPGNKTLAAALAGLNGIATMLIETLTDGVFSRGLNIAGKAMTKTGVDYTANLGVQALVELGKKGTWSNLAARIVDWVTGALDEGFINELPEYVLGEVFNAIYRKANAIPDDKTWEDIKAEAWESIWQGIIVGAVYGTGEVALDMMLNKDLSIQLRREANSSKSWTEFVERTNGIRPKKIEQEVYDKAREQIYKASVEQKADVMKQAFSGSVYESESIAMEELYSTVDSMGVEQSKVLPDGSVYRTESKDLYSKVIQDSSTSYTVAFGDRNTGAVYGTVNVRTDGNVQTITGVRVRHGYENIRTEMVRDAIAQTRSTESDVQWNPTTPGLQSVKDTLVETNPRGKDYGLNFEAKAVGEDSDIKAMALEIRKNAPNLTEQEALVSARLQAITGSGFKVDSVDNISQEQLAGRTDRNFNAATSQAKSLIYLGQQSNVSSFTHELFHAVTSVRQNESAELSSAIRETLNDETRKAQFTSFINDHKEIWEKANDDSSVDEIMARFEQIAGNESTWSPKLEEDLARLWEAYVSSPNSVKNSIPGRIKVLLQKLADLMKQVYRTLRNGVALDPEIAKAYNKLMNLEKDNKAENTGKTSDESETKTDNKLMYQESQDSRYLAAVERGDMETAQRMVDAKAAQKGYVTREDYRDSHVAPGANIDREDFTNLDKLRELRDDSFDLNLYAIANGIINQPEDYFTPIGLRYYGFNDPMADRQSFYAIMDAIRKVRDMKDGDPIPEITVYRAVPRDIKGNQLESDGQWVTPSRYYARLHGEHRFDGKYRIIEQSVPVTELWWDGNDANEWGFDDGRHSVYKNVPNNRKLTDAVTYDDDGNVIPLSKRFTQNNPDIRYQDNDGSTTVQKKNGSLVIVHSMSEAKLRGVIDVGGMPMPSLAITAPKAEVLEPTLNYGEITFIGNSKLAGRVIGSGAVWDRDIWSPTYPQAQYKMNKKGISNELRAIQSNYSKMFDWPHIADEDSWMEYQYSTPEDLILKLKDPGRYPAIALQFLSENGKTVDIPHVPEAHELYSARTLMAARQWLETNKYLTDSNWSELYDSLSLGSDIINAYPSADLPSTASRFFSRQEKYQKRMEYINKIKNDPNLGFDRSYDTVSAIVQASMRSSNAIDYYALGNILDEAINKSEFQTWLERKFNRFYSEPMLKIGNTWKPYNLENIVKYMEKQGVVGATATGFSTDSELAAISAKNLKTREEIRENEDRIYSEPAYRDRISEASDALFNAVSNSKTEGSNVFIETDNVRAVVAEYLQKRKTTKADMKSLLWGAYAKSDSIIDAAYELAELLKAPPQKYFEAKPALVLRTSDFDTVLVPEGISGELVEYLSNSGLNVIKYGSGKQLETFIDTVTTNESLMFQDNDTYNPDEVIENMDSVEDQESMESISDDWVVEEVEIMNDDHSFSMEYPEDWDDVPDFDDDAVDQEQKLQAETPKTPSKYLKNTDNTDITFEQFAKENAPQVVYEGNEEQKDQQFREAIQDEANLRGYLGIIGEALLVDTPSVNAYYEQQFNKTYKRYQDVIMVEPFIDEKYRLGLQSRVSRQVNDADVRRAAKYSVEGKDFPATTGLAEKVRKELSDNARFYRNILAPLIGDKSMLPDTLIEANTKLDLPGRSDMDLMAVSELADIASKYASQAVADKIMDGSLKFGTDEDERIYKEVRETIKSQTDEIKGYEKQVKELEDSNAKLNEGLDRMQTALDERDSLLQDSFQILDELRSTILGDEKSSGRTQLDERYSTLWGELYNLNEEKEYQKAATAKGARDKGKAIGASIGTALWMNDLKALYPQLFVSADGHRMVWQRGKSTKDNAEIRKNIDARREAVKAEMDSIRAEIARGTVRGLMANSIKVSSALSSLKKAVEGISTILSKEEVEQWNSRISELEAQNRELSDSVKELTDSKETEKEKLEAKVEKLQKKVESLQEQKIQAVNDAVLLTRWKEQKKKLAAEKRAEIAEANRKYREKKAEEVRKQAEADKAYDKETLRRWIEAKKENERKKQKAIDDANRKYAEETKRLWLEAKQRHEAEKQKTIDEKNERYTQGTYDRWMKAKQQNALENMARKVREEQREIYRKRIQGIRETNAIAIATARANLFEARRKERQLRQIRMEKQKIASQIMKPVNLKTTDYDTSAKAIVAIQALIDPSFKREWVYDISKNPGQAADLKGYGTMTIDEAKAYFNGLDDAQRMDISQYLSPSLLDRLTGQKKPLNDWTISELKDLASQVQALRDRGKLVLSAKKEAETARDNAIRKAIVNAIQNRIKSKGKTLPGSIERQKEQNKFSVKLQSWLYATYRPQELAQLLDGGFGNHGAAYRLLIDDKRYHQNREWRAVEKRLNKVDPLLTDKVIDQLVDTVTIDLGRGYSRTFTVDELAYVYLAKNDDSNHDAVAYGALMDEYEKGTRIADVEDPLTGENIRQFLFQNPELIVDDNELEKVGRDRFNTVYKIAKQELESRGLMNVVKAISDDFNDAGNKERLNRASIEAYNVPLDARDYYLSIRRIDSKGDAILDDAINGILDVGTNTVISNPEGGFMITRKVIRPRNQGNIDLSLIGNWRRAVADQEHLIENAAYVKQLRSVFASRTSKEVARAIDQAYGTSLRKEIVDYIELIANPNKSEPKTNFDKAVKAFRGRTGAAYLGWKTSGIILQGITSPMPGLSEINPAKLTAAYLQIGAHPIETINMINEKSIFMKKRTMDMIVDEAIQRRSQWNQNRFQKIMNKQEEIGQIGLTLVDRYAVAGNWLAMYNMALQENLENGMDTAVAETAAVQRADNFILRTQPVGDSTEMASMFRKGNEITKAVLQFQASLNVIWNNIVPDTIGFARNKEYGKIVGTMVGYAMAGVILGLVADGFDDDDDTKKKILKLSYWSITQQLSSVPLVSVSGIDGLVQKLITGKSEYSGVGVTIFPGVDKTVQAITAMSQGNWGKAASKAGEAAGIFLGAPTSAIKQYARAATGDWMALLGR